MYSSWVESGAGRLYVEVRSDYLFLANRLLRCSIGRRGTSPLFDSGVQAFGSLWLLSTWTLYVVVTWLLAKRCAKRIWLWLAPPRLAQALQLGAALFAAMFRPRTFEGWWRSSTFATMGFILFSPVSAPNFFLWLIPMVYLSSSATVARLLNGLGWASFIAYPGIQFVMASKAFDLRFPWLDALFREVLFPGAVLVFNAIRAAILALLVANRVAR